MAPINSHLLLIQVLKSILLVLNAALQLHSVLLIQVMVYLRNTNIPFLHSRTRHASLFHKSGTKVGAKLRPENSDQPGKLKRRVSFCLLHVSTPRAQTANRNKFQTNLKLRPV